MSPRAMVGSETSGSSRKRRSPPVMNLMLASGKSIGGRRKPQKPYREGIIVGKKQLGFTDANPRNIMLDAEKRSRARTGLYHLTIDASGRSSAIHELELTGTSGACLEKQRLRSAWAIS